jgi:aminoglycoside phosphotransferase (APT) family kinase protein
MGGEPAGYRAALLAACAAAGLDARDAMVLHVRANAVYHLPREGAVARIRAAPGDPAPVIQRFATSLRVTRWLRGQGFPATEPLALEQPVAVARHVATFWRYVTVTGTAGREVSTLARLLRTLHELPAPAAGLPEANLLGSLRADLHASQDISPGERDWLLARAGRLLQQYGEASWALGTGLVHGDAHAANLLPAPAGPVLGDWDSVCRGPRELDLVPTSMWHRFGRPRSEWLTFCAAYGADPADLPGLPLLQQLRELHGLAAYVRNASDPCFRAELTKRITSLRAGTQTAPWQAL